jgi:hypothetical protein
MREFWRLLNAPQAISLQTIRIYKIKPDFVEARVCRQEKCGIECDNLLASANKCAALLQARRFSLLKASESSNATDVTARQLRNESVSVEVSSV